MDPENTLCKLVFGAATWRSLDEAMLAGTLAVSPARIARLLHEDECSDMLEVCVSSQTCIKHADPGLCASMLWLTLFIDGNDATCNGGEVSNGISEVPFRARQTRYAFQVQHSAHQLQSCSACGQ